MPHPFFDAPVYPWYRADAQDLHRILYQNVTVSKRIELLYQKSRGQTPLTLGGASDVLWKEVLDNLAAEKLLKAFCLHVLTQSDQVVAAHAAIRAVIDLPDTVEQMFLAEKVMVLDRKRLRQELKKLDQPNDTGVLLVRGPPRSGKSWTQKLITKVADEQGALNVYLYRDIVSDVNEAVENLFVTLGDSAAIPPRLGSEDAWYRKVCVRLQELAQARNKVLWVIADDIGEYPEGPRLDSAIRGFFEQFALSMGNPSFAKWFRLVLLDYPDGAVPTRWKDFWCEDRPDENEVDDAAIADFLLKWAAIKQKNLGAEKAAELATDILAKACPPGAQPPDGKLASIRVRLNSVLEGL